MPYRNPYNLAAICGGIIVLCCLLLRIKPELLLSRSPRWFAKLLAAGLVFCMSVFPNVCERNGRGKAFAAEVESQAVKFLEDTERGQAIVKSWKEASDYLYAGQKADYTLEVKNRLKIEMDSAIESLNSLVEEKILSDEEALLLKPQMVKLRDSLYQKWAVDEGRPTRPMVTCYMPVPIGMNVDNNLDDIEKKLPLLQKLAGRQLSPFVVEKICMSIEQDLKRLLSDIENDYHLRMDLDVTRFEKAFQSVADVLSSLGRKTEIPFPEKQISRYRPFKLNGIVGSGEKLFAIVEDGQGEVYTVSAGDMVQGAHKILSVSTRSVEILGLKSKKKLILELKD